MSVRCRFAPSPTGLLHMGTARVALLNILFAESQHGQCVFRIEDTDLQRSTKDSEKSILDGLQWLGLLRSIEGVQADGSELGPYGPYRQTGRSQSYAQYIQKLVDTGQVYECFMTPEELEAEREQQIALKLPPKYSGAHRHLTEEQKAAFRAEGRTSVLRFRVPDDEVLVYHDMIRGDIRQDCSLLGDFVLVRADGSPLFLLVNVIDDVEMRITHVIRGEDHISNTPKQILLYRALGLTEPQFGHLPLILNPDRSKMSKRQTRAADIGWLRQE